LSCGIEFSEGCNIESVEVPDTNLSYDMVMAALRENFDPLYPYDDYGISF
jgi:hypothetical protein